MGWPVFFSGDRLEKNLSLPEANIEVKQPRGVRKARCNVPQSLLHLGDKGSVVDEVSDQLLQHQAVGLEAP